MADYGGTSHSYIFNVKLLIHRLLLDWNALFDSNSLLILINPESFLQNTNCEFWRCSCILFSAVSKSYLYMCNWAKIKKVLSTMLIKFPKVFKVAHLLICNFLPRHFSLLLQQGCFPPICIKTIQIFSFSSDPVHLLSSASKRQTKRKKQKGTNTEKSDSRTTTVCD